MKKALKIIGGIVGGLAGFVLIVACVLVYMVFTPERLTPVVDKVAREFITCDYQIGSVDLTFFSTFPEFGLRADGLLIVNPTEGAQSDTLLEAKQVVARIELMQLLQDGIINVREVSLDDVVLNPYMGQEGITNFDIIALSSDSTQEETEDSESFIKGITFEDLAVRLHARQLCLVDEPDTLTASLRDAELSLTASEKDQLIVGELRAMLPQLSASYCGTDYATDARIQLKAPYRMRLNMSGLSNISFAEVDMNEASLALNEFRIDINGKAQVIPEIRTDLQLATNQWHLSNLLALVPASLFTMPQGISADGDFRLEAQVKGLYNDSTMPLVDATVYLEDVIASYAELPYTLRDIEGEIAAHVDLNQEGLSSAEVRSLKANTKQSSVSATGHIDDVLGAMLLDLTLDVNLHLPDAAYFFPEGISATGEAKGPIHAKIALDDLTNLNLTKGQLSGSFDIHHLHAAMDSMQVESKQAQLAFRIPNTRPANGNSQREKNRRANLNLLEGSLHLSNLNVQEEGSLAATLGETEVGLQLGDILKNSQMIYADVDLKTNRLNGSMMMADSLGQKTEAKVVAEAPAVRAYVAYDMEDTLRIPTLSCTFDMKKLEATYDSIKAHICNPKGSATITGGRQDNTQPAILASLSANDVDANMGKTIAVKTGTFAVKAAAKHTNNTENILLEWQPRLDFHLQKAKVDMAALEPTIKIPEIKFNYSNKDFRIDTSRIELGRSDFSLQGEVQNIGPFLEKTGLLEGTLNFRSHYTDINELLSYISGFGNEEETSEETASVQEEVAAGESDPFIVPKGVDLTLNTTISEADVFDQHLRSMGGRVYIRDGVLIVEEMGFICEAAKLQLTAMYKTPRRNHIFAGFDYHMTDINVEELVNMIPQVDSMLPMLRSFKGAANFHLAAETYLNSQYQIKPSTTRGACSIDAKDLTLLDGETFTKIAKILTFKKKTENKIDSISAEISLYKQQIDVYPFLITCDKWMGAVGGQHNLDMSFNYHVNLLSPLYIGVDVNGTFDDLHIKPAKCIYAKDFRPVFSKKVDTQAADIRKMVKQALEKNLK